MNILHIVFSCISRIHTLYRLASAVHTIIIN